jgi:hypothetical protein
MQRFQRGTLWISLVLITLLLVATGCQPGTGETPSANVKLTATPEATAEQAAVEQATPEPASPTPAPAETTPPTATPTTTEATETSGGSILSVSSSGEGITGTDIILVEVENPEDETITFVLPAGYVFVPPESSGEQRMMVLREESVVIEPGQVVVISPFVACIDPDQAAPSDGSGYSAGDLVENEDLLAFAQCTSEVGDLPDSMEMDFSANLGLQFAVWEISTGEGVTDFFGEIEQGQGALGESMPPEMMEFFESFMGGAAEETEAWLERCGVETN